MISCNDVELQLRNRITGEVDRIRGETSHTTCADGISPCRFLGYRFSKGGLIYFVSVGYIAVYDSLTEILREKLAVIQ